MLKSRLKLQTLSWIGLIGGLILFLIIYNNPVNSKLATYLATAALATFWMSIIILTRKLRPLCSLLVIIPLAAGAIIAYAPMRKIKEDALRERYTRNLESYEGVEYHWGGETGKGIDCSGLPRKAYRLAMAEEGLIRANPALVRESILNWWHDSSALALMEEYRNYVKPLGIQGVLKELPTEQLLPGDLAITASGNHVIVYLGDDQWIQADPSAYKVHTLNAKKEQNPWFDTDVSMFRWSQFPSAVESK
ncbi:NlpC/P60 family protein [Rubritalea squalenifaciens DSM 18772]|uniref:NlpC/P60 family protein n=1 Tax=Rubritalea squalenifaciens DSM 18772 TaxID=1123071 RepID=A0A1M6NKV7_9BACT|nr:NlpC/P60 family protein [Rubritalea squalenifaciens]SHJ96347.1 NlpC/P60 family protein [Rubritalea squalenifaciens DSM 18772]